MKLAFYLSTSLVGLLLVSVLSSVILFSTQTTLRAEATASQLNIDTNSEYANGTITMSSVVKIWYAWVNVSETQVIYYALFSNEVNSPIVNFLGQHFQVENDTEVFVGNTLTLIEVYNDTNGDGISQANFTSGESEIAYYLLVNSSIGYQPTPIQKILKDEIPHYTWGFKYETIDGFLLYPEQQPGQGAARVIIDYLGFNYDFYVVEDVSYIKKNFDIAEITEIQPLSGEQVSLDGLSLSLLFSTITISAKPYTAYVNGQPYNSTTAENPATPTSGGEIAVETIKAYEFLFGEKYNLTRGETWEAHEVKSEAAATTSVPQGVLDHLDWELAYFERHLNLSDLFPSAVGIEGKVSLDYNVSTFLYRICYPVWDGLPIQHDPTYIAYLFSNIIIPEFPIVMVLPVLVITTSLAILTAKIRKRRP
jgi:hypothetical protein